MAEVCSMDENDKGSYQTNWSNNNGPEMQQDSAGHGSSWQNWDNNSGDGKWGQWSQKDATGNAASTSTANGSNSQEENGGYSRSWRDDSNKENTYGNGWTGWQEGGSACGYQEGAATSSTAPAAAAPQETPPHATADNYSSPAAQDEQGGNAKWEDWQDNRQSYTASGSAAASAAAPAQDEKSSSARWQALKDDRHSHAMSDSGAASAAAAPVAPTAAPPAAAPAAQDGGGGWAWGEESAAPAASAAAQDHGPSQASTDAAAGSTAAPVAPQDNWWQSNNDPWKATGDSAAAASSGAHGKGDQWAGYQQKPVAAAAATNGGDRQWSDWQKEADRPPAKDSAQKIKRQKQLQYVQAQHRQNRALSAKTEDELQRDDTRLFDEERLAGAGEDFEVVYKNVPCDIKGSNVENLPTMNSFDDMFALFKDQIPASLEDNIRRCRYKTPTPVQKFVLPCALSGRDVMCCAETGSGKTVSYLIPVLASMIRDHKEGVGKLEGAYEGPIRPDCLILAPTRELTLQIYDDAARFCHRTEFRVVRIYGQEDVTVQLHDVAKGADVVIATPGRLWDYVETEVIDLKKVNCLVLDDADRLLESKLGWTIKPIIKEFGMPDKECRQTMMFSATFPENIQKMALEYLYEHVWVGVGAIGGAVSTVTQKLLEVKQDEKLDKLLEIIDEFFENRMTRGNKEERLMIFTNSIKQAKALDEHLFESNHVDSCAIHSELHQQTREENLKKFRRGDIDVLVCTDVASRGLDIQGVSTVVNFDMARDVGTYVQRIGRTGRIGHKGHSITFITKDRAGWWRDDETVLRDLLQCMQAAHAEIPDWFQNHFKKDNDGGGGGAGAWSNWESARWNQGKRDIREEYQ